MRYIVLFLSLFLLLIPTAVHAQEVNLSISPLQHEILTKPETKITMPFAIKNYGDATLVNFRFVRLSVADSLGNYTLLPLDKQNTPEPQLSFAEPQEGPFLLLANEEYKGTIIVEIPEETKEQDYYYALVTSSENSQGFETSSSIKLHGGVAAPIFITVSKNGNKSYDLQKPYIQVRHMIANAFIPKQVLDTKNPISGTIQIENKGKNMTNVNGTLLLTRSVGFFPFKGFTSLIDSHPVLGHSRISLTLPEMQHMPTGYYTLTAMITNGSTTQSQSIQFILFPVTYTIYLLLAAILGLTCYFVYKRYTNT